LLLALSGVSEGERGSVVGTFSAFFDFANGAGAVVLGAIAALSSYRGAFGFGAILAFVAFVLLRTGFAHRPDGPVPPISTLGAAAFESDPLL
jgi:predicted MFS family arabinose efflux permease